MKGIIFPRKFFHFRHRHICTRLFHRFLLIKFDRIKLKRMIKFRNKNQKIDGRFNGRRRKINSARSGGEMNPEGGSLVLFPS